MNLAVGINPTGDIKGTPKGHSTTGEMGQSLSACILSALRTEERSLTIRDVVDLTNGNYDTVKRELSRISGTGKGSGPVIRVAHGLYKYAPEKENSSLQAWVKAGNWKIENLVFVSLGAHPSKGHADTTLSERRVREERDTPDLRIPTPLTGFPMTLPTGQTITWEVYDNGTEIIRLSANGNMPFSPDHALTLLHILKEKGFDGSRWKCTSIEVNTDSRDLRIDASYSLQIVEGLLLKGYQHGPFSRVELADRRACSTKEVVDLLSACAGGYDGTEALREVSKLTKRVGLCERNCQLAYNVAASVRDSKSSEKRGFKQDSIPPRRSQEVSKKECEFILASEIQNGAGIKPKRQNKIIASSRGDSS